MSQPRLSSRSGGRILVDQLLIHGAEMAFCVPGESYLEVLDALHDCQDSIRLINARHEGGAANMAEAYGKLTGRPGLCLVTRGPGACHAAVGVHTAFQDSTPMILLIGQVGRQALDREAFQEIDYRSMFGGIAKWVAQIERTDRIPEYMARAFRVATSGRPGPVVLALPEDMLSESAEVPDSAPYAAARPSASAGDVERIAAILAQAERPLMIVGGGGWSDQACRDILAFAEANGLPTACSFRRQDVVDNRSDIYVGDLGTSTSPALIKRLGEADLLFVIGARLGEMTTRNYTTLDSPRPRQRLVHVHADADEIGRVYGPDLGVVAAPEPMAAALAGQRWGRADRWRAWCEEARRDYLADIEPPPYDGRLDLGRIFAELRESLPEDAIVTLDAGNHTGWPQRFLSYRRPRRELGPTNGSMGYSVPAAVAASLLHPDRLVIGCVGDGGFMMSGQELATAAQYGAKPIILLFNNGTYGTIRMHQEREHPERVIGTDLVNPDFAGLARAMQAHAEVVTDTESFLPAFERARKSGLAAVIELRTEAEQISTRTTITSLREAARAHRHQASLA
ncbi:thiamine pyrophosphate-binding protein [Telmatospirillum sp. J64-1]|uniref:thiamine pyrophosphate-binding protein n=1 Tax=Telmatospirillum sp. J64-1 TaxID=2502183 RepID=UPI00115F1C32|nr:thiamine pyrophosphate-binding protein [Telmatospirillum sp. J64-1]